MHNFKWLPMDSVPKDGSLFIGIPFTGPTRVRVFRYDPRGVFIDIDSDYERRLLGWMPLPPTPDALEEAANRAASPEGEDSKIIRAAFIAGAKWQKEQQS